MIGAAPYAVFCFATTPHICGHVLVKQRPGVREAPAAIIGRGALFRLFLCSTAKQEQDTMTTSSSLYSAENLHEIAGICHLLSDLLTTETAQELTLSASGRLGMRYICDYCAELAIESVQEKQKVQSE